MLVFDKRAGVDCGEQTPERKKFQIKSLSKKISMRENIGLLDDGYPAGYVQDIKGQISIIYII